jgi:ankyrin repeat protein
LFYSWYDRFRWVYCQLEVLRHCLPPSVRRTLEELPESLDETYERLLKGIKKANRDHAHRLLQCLVVAIRPLLIEQLAEVLAVDFDDAEGIPRLNPDWRWGDQEHALLASCSSLIAIVDDNSTRVVQFSHFSVKEFLTSKRLATSSEDISQYHILLEPSHTILAQACLAALLQLGGHVDKDGTRNKSPLADYAAQWWVDHAKFGNVSSHIRKAMERLFDPDKPHFHYWLRLYDVERKYLNRALALFVHPRPIQKPTPLYCAALFGFRHLTEHLVADHPQYVNACGGVYVTPLVAALAGNHYSIAELLHEHGAVVDIRGRLKLTPLYYACRLGRFENVQWLLNHGADANFRNGGLPSPLHHAALQGHIDLAHILLEHNADAEARDRQGDTPLHMASSSHSSTAEVVQLLLRHGVDVNARSKTHSTPLHHAARQGKLEVVRLLLEHGANAEAKDRDGITAVQLASERGHDETAKLLSIYGGK